MKCVVCKQWITEPDWAPVCCEVCWDSMDAAERRLGERLALLDRDRANSAQS